MYQLLQLSETLHFADRVHLTRLVMIHVELPDISTSSIYPLALWRQKFVVCEVEIEVLYAI